MTGEVVEKTERNWRVRTYNEDDQDQVFALYSRVWGPEVGAFMERIWHWKYEKHPLADTGPRRSLVLEVDGEVAGFLGILPTRFKVSHTIEEGIWGVDHMVAPEHRGRRGIAFARALIDRERLILGQPGRGPLRLWDRQTRFDTALVATGCWVQRKFGLHGLARATARLALRAKTWRQGRPARGSAEPVTVREGVPDALDAWLPDLLRSHKNIAWRDEAYIRWRFLSCPYGVHRVLAAYGPNGPKGYLVFREDTRRLVRVVEVIAARQDVNTYRALLEETVARARVLGKDGVETMASRNGGLADALAELGFSTPLRGYREHCVIGLSKDADLESRVHDTEQGWFIALADSDTDMNVED